jgi:hypothetical protein
MDELFAILGYTLQITEIDIKLVRLLVYIPYSNTLQQAGIPSSSPVLTYRSGSIQWEPSIETIWFYKTEFGEQLERYNSKMNPPLPGYLPMSYGGGLYPSYPQPQSITNSTSIQQQVYIQGLQQAQLSQQGQLQQASLQQNVYPTFNQMYPANSHSIIQLTGDVTASSEPEKPKFSLWNKVKNLFSNG